MGDARVEFLDLEIAEVNGGIGEGEVEIDHVLGVKPAEGVPGAAVHLPISTVHKVVSHATRTVSIRARKIGEVAPRLVGGREGNRARHASEPAFDARGDCSPDRNDARNRDAYTQRIQKQSPRGNARIKSDDFEPCGARNAWSGLNRKRDEQCLAGRIREWRCAKYDGDEMVDVTGFEPATPCLQSRCSPS